MKIVFLLLALTVAASAQASGDFDKFEVGGNFSFQRIDKSGDFNNKVGFNGFEISAVGNLSRYFGIKADFSGAYKENNFSRSAILPPTTRNFTVKSSVYNYLGGIQIKDNSKEKKVKPFAHFLAGAATTRQTLTGNCPNDVQNICNAYSFSKTGFAAVIGGGIDVRMSSRISIRAIQADYNQVHIGERKDGNITLFNKQTSNNFRIGAGIIFH